MFENLYLPMPDPDAYLARIGLSQRKPPSLEALSELIFAHQCTVPFENLDIYDFRSEIALDIPSLYRKLVEKRRGGYCFELNGAFYSLLRSLGYECWSCIGRVGDPEKDELRPRCHRCIIVVLDGRHYYCDVGFGGPSPRAALPLDGGVYTAHGMTFSSTRRNGSYLVLHIKDGEANGTICFDNIPCDPVDFLPANEYTSKNRLSPFRLTRIINLCTENGSVSIDGDVLKRNGPDGHTERQLPDEAALRSALRDVFGIQVEKKLKI